MRRTESQRACLLLVPWVKGSRIELLSVHLFTTLAERERADSSDSYASRRVLSVRPGLRQVSLGTTHADEIAASTIIVAIRVTGAAGSSASAERQIEKVIPSAPISPVIPHVFLPPNEVPY